jgi:hypothetical protein
MAQLLEVSTSGYYAYVKRAAATTVPTPRQERRANLAVKILDVHAESDGEAGRESPCPHGTFLQKL